MASQLLGITYKNGSVTLDTISYTLNIQGNCTSRTQGTLTETYTYGPFGKRTVVNAIGQQIPDTAYANMHGYTGREHLPLRGLMDYRNRSYSTTLGRFLQTDPIRFDAGDVNLYRYVFNSSPNFTDSDGLVIPFAVGAIVVCGIAGGELALITWACMILQPCEEIYLKSPATFVGNFSAFMLLVIGIATPPGKSCFLVAHVRKDAAHICHYDWAIRCI